MAYSSFEMFEHVDCAKKHMSSNIMFHFKLLKISNFQKKKKKSITLNKFENFIRGSSNVQVSLKLVSLKYWSLYCFTHIAP